VSGGDIQQGPPPTPQPPRPSGSPFGRFLTSPVLLVGVLALAVAFAGVRYIGDGDGGTSAAPEPSGIAGSWETVPTSAGHVPIVQLEVARSGGTLTVDGCTGDLTPRESGSSEWAFRYVDSSGERGCPRQMSVTVSLVNRGTLRVDARRRGREYFSGTLRRAG
jgi:hypothetical protein